MTKPSSLLPESTVQGFGHFDILEIVKFICETFHLKSPLNNNYHTEEDFFQGDNNIIAHKQ